MVEDNDSYREGYRRGELERIALAIANSELRSRNRELETELRQLYAQLEGLR
jgi:hypothetical protein